MREREQISSDRPVDDASPTLAQGREPTKQGHLIEGDRGAEQTPTRGAAGDVPTRARPGAQTDTDADRTREREDSPLE